MEPFAVTIILWVAVVCCFTEPVVALPKRGDLELCSPKFSQFSSNHTACLPAPEGARIPVKEGVTASSKTYITNLHNYYRSNVHKFSKQPGATDMQKMYWDDELAMVAQKWASHCVWEHDKLGNRAIPGSYAVGQNLGRGHRGWGSVIRHWQSEVKHLHFNTGKDPIRPVGHYTQMVWADSARIGCGYARCNRTESFYVCSYAPTGNLMKSIYKPYTPGNTTASCPNSRVPGLCDCNGKVCLNGGTLDLRTCQCTCINRAWIKPNGNCALDCSRAEDSFACASNGGKWGSTECEKFSNVPYEYCPVTCNLCSASSEQGQASTSPKMTTPALQESTTIQTTLEEFLPSSTFASPDHFKNNGTWWDAVLNGNARRQTPHTTKSTTTADPKAAVRMTKAPTPRVTPPPSPTTRATTSSAPRTTRRVQIRKVTTTSPPKTGENSGDLPLCPNSVEMAKCGQPTSRGYYNPMYCRYGLVHYCPAMCGKCRVRSCVDYEGNSYSLGNFWMNEYGKITCTANGVKVQRGCLVEASNVVIDELQEYNYRDGNISWNCVCNVGYSLSCKGVWSPSGKVRH